MCSEVVMKLNLDKISTLINEAISLTSMQQPLQNALQSALVEAVRDTVTPRLIQHCMEENGTDSLYILVKGNTLSQYCTQHVVDIFKWELPDIFRKAVPMLENYNIRVYFKKGLNVHGHANGQVVTVKFELLQEVVQHILEQCYSKCRHDDVQGFSKVCSEISFDTGGNVTSSSTPRGPVWSGIKNIVSVIIHEMVHVIQHIQQKDSKNKEYEYRSYLQKDKKKFHSQIKKVTAGEEGMTPEQYKIYRASPQEMTAFAHEEALTLIDRLKLDDPSAGYTLDTAMLAVKKYLGTYIDKMFADKSNRKEYPVFKRYVKMVYLELERYCEAKYG